MGDTLKRKGCDTMHVLVVEDDYLLNNTLCYNLNAAGYKVDSALCKRGAENYIEKQKYELIVLDVNLPDGNGFDFCKEAKKCCPETAVIILTANDMESDMLKGYELGADDYVTKPFGMMELVSRIKAVLRRSKGSQDRGNPEIQGVHIDVKKHEVTVDGRTVPLTLKEFELLEKLMRNEGIVLTRDQLLTEIWGYDFDGETRTVDVHIRTLRQKLGEKGEIIQTVRGVGYRIGGSA